MAEQDPVKPGSSSRQPDAASGAGFFAGGDRRTHLEQLRHLSEWSRRVLVVTGPRGIGKSTLYRQLSASLEPRAKAARISGALVNGARDVLNAMVQGLGLAAPVDGGAEALIELVSTHARAQERAGRFCVTLIDDAELLDARALEAVMSVAARAPLRVVLFGEVRLVPAVQRAASARSVGWHELRLNGFDVVEGRAYLEWRYRQQGQPGDLPFSDAQVKDIVRLAEGLPGRMDQMANVLLARIRSSRADNRRRRFPALHQALLAVLVVVVSFAWLVWPTSVDRSSPPARVERLEIPPPSRPDQTASAIAGTVAEDNLDSPGVIPTEAGVEDVPAEQRPAAGADGVPGTRAQGEHPVSARESPAADVFADTKAPPSTSTNEDEGPGDAAWIMSRPDSAFTLQLASFSTAERANRYLARQADPNGFARFRQQRGGRILHVVIYGEFESHAAAERAAERLPEGAGSVKPWIRSFREVQAAVRTALQS